MDLSNVLSISGLSGLYEMVANRSNGLVVKNIVTGKKQFAPARKHQFSPIETIGIYTIYDTIDIGEVFDKMHAQAKTLPVPEEKLKKEEAFEYFGEVIPEFDREQVRLSDINRLCKWYHHLIAAGRHIDHSEEE